MSVQQLGSLPPQWRERLWSTVAKAYDFPPLQKLVYRPTQQKLLYFLRPRSPENILDVGCGTGEFTRCLADTFRNAQVTGVDMARGMISEAQTKVARDRDRLAFHIGDAQQLDFPDQCYDLLTCTNSLIFYPNPQLALAQMHRVLKSGAQLGLVNLVMPSWTISVHLRLGGIHLPTLMELQQWCETAGFEVERAGYVHRASAWIFPFGFVVAKKR